jgi:hypothetical protein
MNKSKSKTEAKSKVKTKSSEIIQVILPIDVSSEIRALAAKQGSSVSGYIRALCAEKANAAVTAGFWQNISPRNALLKEAA